ncbi:MAG: preprotein translocase subunit SecG [Elusimicrobia bacterium]|nr:preprotein translocase subunit SecG [Elusimicrobiota bacterium]
MYTFLLTVHVVNCALMILVILLQAGRGAGFNVFGGGGGDALFNAPSSTSFMKQLTAGLAITFAVTSLFLTLLSGRSGMTSVTSKYRMPPAPPKEAPQQPPAPSESSAPDEKAPRKAPMVEAEGKTPAKK